MLPNSFLAIPAAGTLNVHPSLLPLYRGAAPVPRALQVCLCVCLCLCLRVCVCVCDADAALKK